MSKIMPVKVKEAVADFGFIRTTPTASIEVLEVSDKPSGVWVRFRLTPIGGERPSTGRLSDAQMATDPDFNEYLEEADGGLVFKENTTITVDNSICKFGVK